MTKIDLSRNNIPSDQEGRLQRICEAGATELVYEMGRPTGGARATGMCPASEATRTPACLGRVLWLRRVRLESPLGHGNFLPRPKSSGECDGGLGLARFSAVCPLDGHMCANGLLWHAGMAGAPCMGLNT